MAARWPGARALAYSRPSALNDCCAKVSRIVSDRNPYSPPKALVDDVPSGDPAAPTERLFTSRQLFAASFLGSPMAAAWFAAVNYRALGQPAKATSALMLGVVSTILLLAIAFVLPEQMPSVVLPLAYSFAIQMLADKKFGRAIAEHQRAGGQAGKWGIVVGVSLVWLIVVFVALLVALFILEELGFKIE